MFCVITCVWLLEYVRDSIPCDLSGTLWIWDRLTVSALESNFLCNLFINNWFKWQEKVMCSAPAWLPVSSFWILMGFCQFCFTSCVCWNLNSICICSLTFICPDQQRHCGSNHLCHSCCSHCANCCLCPWASTLWLEGWFHQLCCWYVFCVPVQNNLWKHLEQVAIGTSVPGKQCL